MKTCLRIGLLLAILLNGALPGAEPVPDDDTALQLLEQAKSAFAIGEDPNKALDLLSQAEIVAQSDVVMGKVLLETAYIRWMRLESPALVRELLSRAAARIGPPGREYDSYPQAFRRIWRDASREKTGSRRRFQLEILLNLFNSADSRFSAAYGRGQLLPEIRLAFAVFGNWQVWGSFSSFSFSETLPVIEVELKGYQSFAALGLGWEYSINNRLALNLAAGVEWVRFQEKAPLEQVRESCMGLKARAGLRWRFSPDFYLSAGVGFDKARITLEQRSVRPGGWSLGAGLGFRF